MNESHTKTQQNPNLDPDAIIKKWEPMTVDMDSVTVGLASWCMEHEARHLNGMFAEERSEKIGAVLKFLFPTIRRVIIGFSALDRMATMDDPDALGAFFQSQVAVACDAMVADLKTHRNQDIDADEIKSNEFFSTLGARLADYTLSYPRLN